MMFTLVHVAGVFLLMGSLTTEGRLHGTKTTLTMVPSAANEPVPRPFRGLDEGEESEYVADTEEIVDEAAYGLSDKEIKKAEKQAEEEAKATLEAEKKEAKVAEKEAKKAAEEAEKFKKMTQAYEKKMTKENEALAKKEAAEEKAVEDYIEADMMIEAVYANETKAIKMGDLNEKEEKKMKEGKNDTKAEAYTAGSMSAAASENMNEVDEMEEEGDEEENLLEEENTNTTEEEFEEAETAEDSLEEEKTTEEEIEVAEAMEAEVVDTALARAPADP